MCLIAFALNAHPACPLLIAANRDEHLARPTQALQPWRLPSGKTVLGGRDLHAGGTWLGITPGGRVAMLTNVREGLNPPPSPLSRGELTTRWLDGQMSAEDFAHTTSGAQYSGFNLVLGDIQSGAWAWVSNRPAPSDNSERVGSLVFRSLAAGVYGLSNAALDTPWPKTKKLKGAMQSVLDPAATSLLPDWRGTLLHALMDRQRAPLADLPETGAPRAWEQALSSPFVNYMERQYGTRCSTLVHAGAAGLELEEWTHLRPDDPKQARDLDGLQEWPLRHSDYKRAIISM